MRTFLFKFLNKITNFLSGKGLGDIWLISKGYHAIYNKLNPKEIVLIDLNDKKIYVNSRDSVITPSLFLNGTYEPFETEIFREMIKEGDVLLDIGANIGYYSLIASPIIKTGKIYSFEPEPNNYDLLLRNIEINKYDNITPVNCAVSNANGKTNMCIDYKNTGSHSFSNENVPNLSEYLEVNTIKLDDYLESIDEKNVDFIKMDVQGAEGLVMDGLINTLTSNNSIKILMEFWPEGLINMGTNPKELLNEIISLGFDISVLDETKKDIISLSVEEIINSCLDQNNKKEHLNLLLIKSPIHK